MDICIYGYLYSWMKDIMDTFIQSVNEGYYGLDRSVKIYNGEANCGGESELEAPSCQPLFSLRRR